MKDEILENECKALEASSIACGHEKLRISGQRLYAFISERYCSVLVSENVKSGIIVKKP